MSDAPWFATDEGTRWCDVDVCNATATHHQPPSRWRCDSHVPGVTLALSVCVDCLMLCVNADGDPSRWDSHWEGMPPYHVWSGHGNDACDTCAEGGSEWTCETAFSASSCDGCGDSDGGARHPVTLEVHA